MGTNRIFTLQNLQKEQQNRIRELEKEVMTMRGKHSETIQSLKSRFLKDKWKYQQEAEAKISSMSKQANKVCLSKISNVKNVVQL